MVPNIFTSEGVISYIIANTDDTLSGSKALVIGYGICGRDLCRRLKALDADVCALVRRELKEAEAAADGIEPIYMEDLGQTAFDIIVNTVPARVLSNERLTRFKGTLMIDIASAPYGFDMEFAKELNGRSALLAGIPGKYATKRAGEILGKFVYDKRCEYV
ncbi:MAG: hypothetical protein FWC55_10580 [Firmicutes bacterium]|nr:hypothetical protein [Bacillota bacterium]